MTVAYAQPPLDMVPSHAAHVVSTAALGAVAAGALIASIVYWRRTGNSLFVLGMIGGTLAMFNEPFADIVGMCYLPVLDDRGTNWTIIESFGRGIPAWAALCYPVYFGALSCYMLLRLRRGVTYRAFWIGAIVVMIGNGAFELPILAADVYVYYGDQPFEIFGMQPAFFVINAVGAVLGALVMGLLEGRLGAARKLLLVLVPPITQVAAYGIAFPHIFTLNSDLPLGVKYIGTASTIALGLVALGAMGRYAVRFFGPTGVPVAGASPAPAGAAEERRVDLAHA